MKTLLCIQDQDTAWQIESLLKDAEVPVQVIDTKMSRVTLAALEEKRFNIMVMPEDIERASNLILPHFPDLQTSTPELAIANAIGSMRIPIAITALIVVGLLALYFVGVIH